MATYINNIIKFGQYQYLNNIIMNFNIENLKNRSKQVSEEKRTGGITAKRIGSLFMI
ncbi:hypothetical protein [Elizabethkingia anophelis]|uniref:hypothetical protein n=1 Tax=Elizabethkingia anophelis TaxID=1117645 RepID=UPI00389203E1